jgi:D-arabinose 1-dehydrogenase-like Zn-dependent alcohol dehydrogenase
MAVTEKARTSAEPSPTSYRAAEVHRFHDPLTVEQVPRRELEPGQVRAKVEASGLCHTDIHAAHGDWPVKPSPPFVPGHEGVGLVVELGPGTRTDLREVFELHRAGKTHVTREVRPLEAVNEAIADVKSGRVAARVVFEL